MVSDEDLQQIDEAYQQGQKSGVEAAAAFLMKRAAEYFRRGDDDKARMLQDLSNEIDARKKG